MLSVRTVPLEPIGANAYVLTDTVTGKVAVVDPGAYDQRLLGILPQGKVSAILLTHGHYDHIGGVADLAEQTGATIYLAKEEAAFPANSALNLDKAFVKKLRAFVPEHLLNDGDTILLGETTITMLHTPGHTQGSCCYFAEGNLFSGDTLFTGSMGRTDFPTGDSKAMMHSLHRLSQLPEETVVYPGHGPSSTIAAEKRQNPYMREAMRLGDAL